MHVQKILHPDKLGSDDTLIDVGIIDDDDMDKLPLDYNVSGLLIIRNAINAEEQKIILNMFEKNKKNMFMTKNTDVDSDQIYKYNYFDVRGRYFNSIDKYPLSDLFKTIMNRCSKIAKKHDKTIGDILSTHLLTMCYPTKKGMGFHRDSHSGNNGDIGSPVYSFTLGYSAIFEFEVVDINTINSDISEVKSHKTDVSKKSFRYKVKLNTGDLIIFGGKQRLIRHRVKKVILDDTYWCRINLTFRQLLKFTEKDVERYTTESYVERQIKERLMRSKIKSK